MTASGTTASDPAANTPPGNGTSGGGGTESERTPGTGADAPAGAAPAPGGAPDTAAPEPPQAPVRMTAWVRGRVQGVGFRWFTRENALRIGGLDGFAVNLDDGRVQVVAEGSRQRCEALLEWLRTGDTPGRVDGVTEIWGSPRGGYSSFAIR